MQSPWVFFTSAVPQAAKPVVNGGVGLFPSLHHHQSSLLSAPGGAPQAYSPYAAAAHHAHAHPHSHTATHTHPSQLLLAAAAYSMQQQCAAANLLHQQQQQQQHVVQQHHQHHQQQQHQAQTQLQNGNYHLNLKVDEGIVGLAMKRKLGAGATIGVPETQDQDGVVSREIKKAKLETKALKAKRPGFTDERYNETNYYVENGLRKVYPYYFTFTTFTKGRWVGEKILDVFAREFRAHPAEEYERCIKSGTLTVNYTKVDIDYRLKHNDLLANIVHRHETPVLSKPIKIIHLDDELVVLDKPCSIPVHPCGRYRHNTVVFILAKQHQLKNLRTIHRLDRLTSGLLLFGRSPKKAREMEQQIRNRLVSKEYVCRVDGEFPDHVECGEPIEVVSYKIGVCKVAKDGKECHTTFKRLSYNGKSSVVLCRPKTGRMHQIRVHLQYLGYPIVNDPLYNHEVFGPEKGKGGNIGKTDEALIAELINIHNAESWLGVEGDEGSGGGDFFGTSSIVTNPSTPSTDTSSSSTKNPDEILAEEKGDFEGEKEKSTEIDGKNGPSLAAAVGVGEVKEEIKEIKKVDDEVVLNGKMVTVGTQTYNNSEDSSPTASDPPGSGASSTTSAMSPCSSSTSTVSLMATNEPSDGPLAFRTELMTYDVHCYECKVRYRDPKPKDLVMYLHALSYEGPGWRYETKLPCWAKEEWIEPNE